MSDIDDDLGAELLEMYINGEEITDDDIWLSKN